MRKWTEYRWWCPFITAVDGQPSRAETASASVLTRVHHRKLISTAVYPREIAKGCLLTNAAACILGHNHPSGATEPSAADKRITERINTALGFLDIRVLDHVIVSTNSTFLFAEGGLI